MTMANVLSSKEHKSAKIHNDDAADYFDFCIRRDDSRKLIVDPIEAADLSMTPEDIATIQHSIDNKWKILPGEMYTVQTAVEGRELWNYKTRTAIHEICIKYKLYTED